MLTSPYRALTGAVGPSCLEKSQDKSRGVTASTVFNFLDKARLGDLGSVRCWMLRGKENPMV